MQKLLTELFWGNEELHHTAGKLCQSLPGYGEALQEYDKVAEEVRALIGFALYDQFLMRLNQYNDYEVRAYYSLGLNLRQDILQLLNPQ